jgi:hypothetical protein
MESMRESWTGERLDELNGRVDRLSDRMDRGFERVREEIRELRTETQGEFVAVRAEMKAGFDGIHRLMIQTGVVMGGALVGLVAALIGLIATRV